jgi:hypothetical protein
MTGVIIILVANMIQLIVMIRTPVQMTLVMNKQDVNIPQLIMMMMMNALMIVVAQLEELPILINQFLLMMLVQL